MTSLMRVLMKWCSDEGLIENVWNAVLTGLKQSGSNHVRTLRWIMYFGKMPAL